MNQQENKNAFFMGIGIGSLVTAMVLIVIFMGGTVYARQMRWRGIDPNTKIMEIYGLLNHLSIVPFDKDVMLENMYRGFLEGVGDPYTQYLCASALEAFHARTEGTFVGIGVMISVEQDDPYITIASTFQGAPAAEAGLLPGDRIVGVDGLEVAGRAREEVVGLISGPENTVVVISIFRPYENERFDVEITRARVEVPTVFHEMMYIENGPVGYIRLDGFDRVTAGQFENALSELYAAGMNGLILDVRNNPGGLLCSVNEIADHLIPEGIILYTIDAAGRRENHYSNPGYLGLPLVLLVNGRSASASEVLSGAVRDTETGTIVGTQTFGKGVVQNLLYLSDGTAIKLTVQTYHTPNGECIHGVGITPHKIVEMSDYLSRRVGNLTLEEDIQLQAAIEVMAGKF
ncbi:MAG: S41 family peptidase [Defluviitaleaceae bacterium]|nr:S41 family peptidase [Defluviitaleaceae bacterium]MCL2264081.1 S41 family peptidase [Defluviitaleaceae bacterium]